MYLLGIAGGSGSGKTTFATKIIERLNIERPESARASVKTDEARMDNVAILHQDSYYLPELPDSLSLGNGAFNFDHPDAFDWELLKFHLSELKAGRGIEVPAYDFKTNRRSPETTRMGPVNTVILEGIYALWDAEIRRLFDIKIYLSVDADIRFIRRLNRDVRERGRSLDGIVEQYYRTVRPMHSEFLEPTRQYADLTVGNETDIAAEVVAARLSEVIRVRDMGLSLANPSAERIERKMRAASSVV